MSAFDEYINKLEGVEFDPQNVLKDLHDIHTQELGIRQAKIEELGGAIAERDSSINALSAEITQQKARNYDLIDVKPDNTHQSDDGESKPDAGTIKIGDLFNNDVRKRHGL